MPDDYDSPWKEVLEQYFEEFIAFFFPKAHKDIDWTKGYEFLGKELQQITKDAETKRRYVDKLAKVFLKNGEETWNLIHTDIQNDPEKDFTERMYIYNYRIFDKFKRPAASFAVLASVPEERRVDQYKREIWDCKILFEFPIVNLKDYAKDQDSLIKSSNPFAVVVMAHLLARKTSGRYKNRLSEKVKIVRHLYEKGFSRQDVINLFRFIDWVMDLPEKDTEIFWEEVSSIEKEEKMQYVTSIERIGYKKGEKDGEKKGKKKGRKEGQKEGQISLLARQIAKKFKSQISKEFKFLENLNLNDLAKLGENLFDFNTLDEVHHWIENRLNQKQTQKGKK